MKAARRRLGTRRQQLLQLVGQVERQAPVALAEGSVADPHHLARRAEQVEVLGAVFGQARGQHLALQRRGRQDRPLELLDHVEQRVGPTPRARPRRHDPLPVEQQPGQGRRLGRLDRAPQGRQRAPPQGRQHVGLAPLGPGLPWPELPLEHAARGRQGPQRPLDGRHAGAVARRQVAAAEGAVGARIARDQLGQRVVDRLQEGLGQARRRRHPQRVAQPAGVLGRQQARLAGHRHLDHAPLGQQLRHPAVGRRGRLAARAGLVARQVAQAQQQVVQAVGAPRAVLLVEGLQGPLQRVERGRVEQLAQLGLAQQLAQLARVDHQGLGAPLLQRRVALVEVVGHVAEQQRRGEGRGAVRVDRDQAQAPLAGLARHLLQGRQVEDVLQALAVGLEQDREVGEARRHLQQVVGALALHPQGRALSRAAARQQQGARGALAEGGGEERRAGQLARHQLLDLLGVGQQVEGLGRPVAVG